jgi:LuxR family maltose regulon positive regulatory protein
MNLTDKTNDMNGLTRSRIHALLDRAAAHPVVLVCAGAGYGKTLAVRDYTDRYGNDALWVDGDRWAHDDALLRSVCNECRHEPYGDKKRCLVIDFAGQITQQAASLLERLVADIHPHWTLFLLCRAYPRANRLKACVFGGVSDIGEKELRFTPAELAQYLYEQGIQADAQVLSEILSDTDGWPISVSLTVRRLKNAPGYAGYVQSAVASHVRSIMDAEMETNASGWIKRLLVTLSLTDHFSADFINEVAGGRLIYQAEFARLNAYLRFDSTINAYIILPQFLKYLRAQQDSLPPKLREDTYHLAGDWCLRNGFLADALKYYEYIGDYASVASLLAGYSVGVPQDIALIAQEVLNRAPDSVFSNVQLLAARHLCVLISLGLWEEASARFDKYERLLSESVADAALRNHGLGMIYYYRGVQKTLIGDADDGDGYGKCFAKMAGFLSERPANAEVSGFFRTFPFAVPAGSPQKGVWAKYVGAFSEAVSDALRCLTGTAAGFAQLCMGELYFFMDDIQTAESLITRALSLARKYDQRSMTFKAYFYLVRMAVAQGDCVKAEQAMNEIEALLAGHADAFCFTAYDIILGWYGWALREPGRIPNQLKACFIPYAHAAFSQNAANQIMLWYCYLTKDYPRLLAFLQEAKQRELPLYLRVEYLAIEACVHYQKKDKRGALAVFARAYAEASPDGILMPFAQMGKDMRALAACAIRTPECDLPAMWLETVHRRASTYAKRQSIVIGEYHAKNGMDGVHTLSFREKEMLCDLCNGLSRAEIANSRNLSVNTVNSAVNNIYTKMNANGIVDLVRIAIERKLLR